MHISLTCINYNLDASNGIYKLVTAVEICRILKVEFVGIIWTGVGIPRIELNAHPCQTHVCVQMSVQRALVGQVQKLFDFINRTDKFKTSLNVAEIQV